MYSRTTTSIHHGTAIFALYYDEITNKAYFVFQGKLYPMGIMFPIDRQKAYRKFCEIAYKFDLSFIVDLYFPKHLSRDVIGKDMKFLIPQMDDETSIKFKYLMVFDLYEYRFRVDKLEIIAIPHLYYTDGDLETYIREALLYDNGIVKLFDEEEEAEQFKQKMYEF